MFSALGHSSGLQTGPSRGGLCSYSPDNKRCAGLNAAEPDETPPSPAVTEGDCCGRKDYTRERTKDTSSETHPVTVNMGAVDQSSKDRDHELNESEKPAHDDMCPGASSEVPEASKGNDHQLGMRSVSAAGKACNEAPPSSAEQKQRPTLPPAGVSGNQGWGWLPSHRGEAHGQANMHAMQDSDNMCDSFPSPQDQTPTSSSVGCLAGERTTAIGTRGRQACEPPSPTIRH